jgi:HSP20 family molecular chaperone IbpA
MFETGDEGRRYADPCVFGATCFSDPDCDARSLRGDFAVSRLSVFNSPLLLGFDHFERMLERISKTAADGYPPYNIERIDDNRLNITLAVAGFFTEDLEVSIENNQLMIRGKQIDDPDRLYLHRGIAARQFQRSFVLAEGIEVTGASLDNGLLSIDLARPKLETRRRNIVIRKVERGSPSITMAANTKDQSS